ncbi:MAG: ATP-binding protein [Thermoleophilia bacterium]
MIAAPATDATVLSAPAAPSGRTSDPPGGRSRRLPSVAPRLRRRLALAFAGAVILTAFLLSTGSYWALRTALDREATDAALSQARFNLLLADTMLPDAPAADDYDRLLAAFAIRGDFQTLIETADETYSSGPQVTPQLVEAGLADAVTPGRLSYQTLTLAAQPALAVAGSARDEEAVFYFFFPQGERQATLTQLRDVLAATALILALLGTSLGYLLARRTLRPVSQAVAAAAAMADGDLTVRLPTGPDEFGALALSFNRMAESLDTKITDLQETRARELRFVGDVAHELRTPVAALVGEVSLLDAQLADPGLSPETRRAGELLVQDVGRLKRLIEDLLEISRLDAGAEEVRLERVDPLVFLRQMAEARGWPAEVTIDGQTGLLITTDRRRLERVIVNLVENAVRHGAPPVEVGVHAVSGPPGKADQVVMDVTDHGRGLAPETARHVFERFYKADPSRSSRGGVGSGLGLAIAWENVRLLGGVLQIKSKEGEGTRFLVRLPTDATDGPSDTLRDRYPSASFS